MGELEAQSELGPAPLVCRRCALTAVEDARVRSCWDAARCHRRRWDALNKDRRLDRQRARRLAAQPYSRALRVEAAALMKDLATLQAAREVIARRAGMRLTAPLMMQLDAWLNR